MAENVTVSTATGEVIKDKDDKSLKSSVKAIKSSLINQQNPTNQQDDVLCFVIRSSSAE